MEKGKKEDSEPRKLYEVIKAVGFAIYSAVSVAFLAANLDLRKGILGYREYKKRSILIHVVKERLNQILLKVEIGEQVIQATKIPSEAQSEEEIVRELLSEVPTGDNPGFFDALNLLYFCLKSTENKIVVPHDYELIEFFARRLGIGSEVGNRSWFIPLYQKVFNDIAEQNIERFEISFISKYSKSIYFSYITKELNQRDALVSTLRQLITEGRLSNYQIHSDALSRLESELSVKIGYSGAFLIIGQGIPDEVKNFLDGFPHIHGSGGLRIVSNSSFKGNNASIYLVKTDYPSKPEKILQELKLRWNGSRDATLRIYPIEILKGVKYTFPENGVYTNPRVEEASKQLKHFDSFAGISEESMIWSLINRSSISIDELLSELPFNILTHGVLPSEMTFIISNYGKIKDELQIKTLTDVAKIDPTFLSSKLLSFGMPRYTDDEIDTFGIKGPNKKSVISGRFQEFALEIVKNARNFSDAIHTYKSQIDLPLLR